MAVTRSNRRSRLTGSLALVASTFTLVNGWRPVSRRGGRRSIPLFVNGLIGSEAPVPVALVHLVVAARLARRTGGAVRAIVASVGLAGVAAGILQYRQARTTAARLPEIVTHDLDRPVRSSIDGVTPRANRAPWPLLHRSYTSTRTRGIPYGDHGVHNTLDVWRRPDVAGHTPVIVQVHGGGWCIGDNRTQGVPLMTHLAEAGWTCVAPRYRLSPRATWPDHVGDIQRVIAWVRSNIESFGGDPSFVALTGGSAGAHLVSLAGLLGNDHRFAPELNVDTRVQAVVPFYGIYDWVDRDGEQNPAVRHLLEKHVVKNRMTAATEVFHDASPINHLHPDAPPFFVLHGTNDSLLHVEPARRFVEELRRVSRNPVLYAELATTQHSFDLFRTPRARGACDAVNLFLTTLAHESAHRPLVADE